MCLCISIRSFFSSSLNYKAPDKEIARESTCSANFALASEKLSQLSGGIFNHEAHVLLKSANCYHTLHAILLKSLASFDIWPLTSAWRNSASYTLSTCPQWYVMILEDQLWTLSVTASWSLIVQELFRDAVRYVVI